MVLKASGGETVKVEAEQPRRQSDSIPDEEEESLLRPLPKIEPKEPKKGLEFRF